MVKTLLIPVIFILIITGFFAGRQPSEKRIMKHFSKGRFSKAEQLINQAIKTNPDEKILKKSEIIQAKMDRIQLDFSNTEFDIKKELLPYFPELSGEQLREWEKAGKLEMRIINGKRKYFRNAVSNLFRLDKQAALVKEERNGKTIDPLKEFCIENTFGLVEKAKSGVNLEDLIYKYEIDFTITLKPDAVPAGETVKCWIPFPRISEPRQQNVKLLKVNSEDYILASNKALQRTLYMEKKTAAGQPTVFNYSARFETHPQWSQLTNHDIKPYNKKSKNSDVKDFYISGIDGYRLIINDDFSRDFEPHKNYFRSEPIDFQRGELEWSGGNIYFDKWNYNMDVKYLKSGE